MQDLSASMVVYKNSAEVFTNTIKSFFAAANNAKPYLIDNNPWEWAKIYEQDFFNERTIRQFAETG